MIRLGRRSLVAAVVLVPGAISGAAFGALQMQRHTATTARAAAASVEAKAVVEHQARVDAFGNALVVHDLATGLSWPLTPPIKAGEYRIETQATWSPDGRSVAFVRQTRDGANSVLVVAAARAGAPHQPTEVAGGSAYWAGARWMPDGRSLLVLQASPANALYRVEKDGRGLRLFLRVPRSEPRGVFKAATPSPDGRRILIEHWVQYGRWEDGVGPVMLQTIKADGTGLSTVLRVDLVAGSAWSPDGATIAFVEHCAYGGDGHPCRLAVADPALKRKHDLSGATTGNPSQSDANYLSFAWRPNRNTIIYTRRGAIYEISPQTERTRRIRSYSCPFTRCELAQTTIHAVSSDGATAIASASFAGGGFGATQHSYVVDLSTGASTQLGPALDDIAALYLR